MPTISFTRALERFLPAPTVAADGATLGEALAAVFGAHPKLRSYIVDDQGGLRPHVAVYVNGEAVRDRRGLSDPLRPEDEVFVMQALTGG